MVREDGVRGIMGETADAAARVLLRLLFIGISSNIVLSILIKGVNSGNGQKSTLAAMHNGSNQSLPVL